MDQAFRKGVIAGVVLTIFILKSMLPLGFMPNVQKMVSANFITICSGVNEVQLNADALDPHKSPIHEIKSPCDFALASVFASSDNADIQIAEKFISRITLSAEEYTSTHDILLHQFEQRGPPQLT